MTRTSRFGSFVLAIVVCACSDDGSPAGPSGPGVPHPDPGEIARTRIEVDDQRVDQITLRRSVTREVRVIALDASGDPVPGGETHLRLETADLFVASTRRAEDDDPADGARAFEVDARALGRTDLVATVEGGSPNLTGVLQVDVIPRGPAASELPGRYLFRGRLVRLEDTCPDAVDELVVEGIEASVEGETLRLGFDFGALSGRYDPLSVSWLGIGNGALDDGSGITLRMEGVWLGADPRITLDDLLGIRRVDEAGETICSSTYSGSLLSMNP